MPLPGGGAGARSLPGSGGLPGMVMDDPRMSIRTVRTSNKSVAVQIELEGVKELRAIFRKLGMEDAAHLRKALERVGKELLFPAVRAAAGSVSSAFGSSVVNEGVKGKGASLRAVVAVTHPGAKPMEFGRVWYYRGFRGRQMKATGIRYNVGPGRGQQARPYLGIIKGGGVAVGIGGEAAQIIEDGIEQEFEALCMRMGVSDRGALMAVLA